MIELEIDHHIQKHIISVLLYRKTARFSQLRSPRVDTNLFSYHLKSLVRSGLVQKTDRDYMLSSKGLAYVDRVSAATFSIRKQPKIITMLLVQNSEGDVLLQKRTKQPYIDTWTLPYGKVHIDDRSVLAAAAREASEKLSLSNQEVRHAGDCYIRSYVDGDILSTTLAHICRFETDAIQPTENIQWVQPLTLGRYPLAPAVEQIVARAFFGDDHFFAEFDYQWEEASR